MRVCQKSQVVRPEGAIWAFSSHCLSFVKALPYTHINLPDKLQFISLQLSESPK